MQTATLLGGRFLSELRMSQLTAGFRYSAGNAFRKCSSFGASLITM
jgi:hypothetical protein